MNDSTSMSALIWKSDARANRHIVIAMAAWAPFCAAALWLASAGTPAPVWGAVFVAGGLASIGGIVYATVAHSRRLRRILLDQMGGAA